MASGATVEELLEQLIEVTKAGSGASDAPPALGTLDLADFRKQLKQTTDKMKEGLTHQKKLSMLMRGEVREHKDISESLKSLDNELEQLDESLRHRAVTHDDINKRAELSAAKSNLIMDTAFKNAGATAHNFGIGVMGVAATMSSGAITFAKGLQSNASGVEVGTQAMIDGAKATGESLGVFGSAVSGAAGVAGLFLKGPWKYVAQGVGLAGEALGIFAKKAAEVSEKGIAFLGDELKKTVKSYKDATQAGVVLGGGMTEMRQIAYDAGLSIDQLSTVVTASKEDIALMGMGMGEATKRLTGVSKELRRSELGSQLRNLGYGVEEQTELIAAYSARQRQAGDTRIQSDLEIAKGTAAYGKDLKVLADITGKDAKAAMEKAAEQAMEQDLYAEAQRKGGTEAVEKLQAQLATMPEAMKKGYMEFVSTGGTAIADAATNVAISQNPKIMEQYKQQYDTLGNANKNASAALDETGRLNEQTGKYAKEHNANSKEIAMASRLTGDTLTRGATDIQNDLIKVATRTGEGTTNKAREEVDKSAANTAPLDKAVNDLEESAQSFKAALGKETTGAITNFADTLRTGAKSMEDTLDELGLRKKSMTEKVGEVGGGVAGGVGGAAIGATAGAIVGSIVPVIGTAFGAWAGGALGGMAGGWLGSKAGGAAGHAIHGSDNDYDKEQKQKSMPKMATGGITQGESIVGEAGPEAVVPLPNQKSIPVHLNAGNLADQLTESIAKSQYKQNKQADYADLPKEMQEWIKTRTQYDAYKKITSDDGSNAMVSRDPDHAAKLDAIPKYLEDQNKILKEKYGRDIAQEFSNANDAHAFAMDQKQKKIYGDDINAYYDKLDNMTKMAKGGITKGPSIAGEAGPEAVIPLIGGAVPVTMSDKSFMTDSKKPDTNFEDIKRIIGTVVPPIGMIGKAVDFFTKPAKPPEMPKEMSTAFQEFTSSNKEIAMASRLTGDALLDNKTDKSAKPPEMPKEMSTALQEFTSSNKEIAMASRLTGDASIDQVKRDQEFLRGVTDMQNGLAMSKVGDDGIGKSNKKFDDMTRMIGIAIPQVSMIGKAIDFFTKKDDATIGSDKIQQMPKEMQAGFLDFVKNTKTDDVANTAAISQNPKLLEQYTQMAGTMPTKDVSRPDFDTSKLLDAASPMLGMLSKAISTISDNKNSPADTNNNNVNPGTDMGLGMGSKPNLNSNSDLMDSFKELPDLLKAMISRSDDQLQELRATRNIQQQIANNY